MSAALEFTPAVCFPIPDGVAADPRLRVVGLAVDPAPDGGPHLAPRLVPQCVPDAAGDVSVLHAPRELDRATPVRLTRRGVVVLSALVAAVAGALLCFAALSAPGASDVSGAVHGSSVTVRAGDTLWSIAGRVAPGSDPRAEVAALQRRNHLRDEQLTPGQTLRVP